MIVHFELVRSVSCTIIHNRGKAIICEQEAVWFGPQLIRRLSLLIITPLNTESDFYILAIYLYIIYIACIWSHSFHRKPHTRVVTWCLVGFAVQTVTTGGAVATRGPTWARSAHTVGT